MGRRDELYAALSDGARGRRFELGADLVDYDHFRHVVLHRLDHDGVLQCRRWHLHAAGLTDRRMRDVTIASDLVRCIDDHHALVHVVREDARDFA